MFSGYYGVGMHTPSISPLNLAPMLKANLACRVLYTTAVFCVKSSILLFYLRLDPHLRTRRLVYVLLVSVALLTVVTFFVLLFVCMPPSLFWDLSRQAREPEKCLTQSTQQVFFEVNGGVKYVRPDMEKMEMEETIYSLPLFILWKLQMPRSQKVALGALLCVGLVAVVAGCVRFYYVLSLGKEEDIWWYMADSLNWFSVEIYAAIICSSASTLKILVKTYIPRVWNSSIHASRSRSHSNGRHVFMQSNNTSTRHKRSGSKEYSTKPCSAGSEKELSERKYGFDGLTEMENESEEAIVGVSCVGEEKEDDGSRDEGVREEQGLKDEEGRSAMMTEVPRVEDDRC
ncbi:hypothetical protein Ptr902_11135 [Pyrenophora tritici-repentis]|nr:hypothetical protein Ptr902_11135 [Pyrenophora tritici-repentis]